MLSVLGISISVGMIIGAALYPYISRRIKNRTIVILSGYSIGINYFSFLLVGQFVGSIICRYVIVSAVTFYLGFTIALLSGMSSVEFIKNVKEEYLARTSALFGALCVAAMPVVSFIISALAGFASTGVLIAVAGALDIVFCMGLCRKKYFVDEGKTEEVDYCEVGDSQAG